MAVGFSSSPTPMTRAKPSGRPTPVASKRPRAVTWLDWAMLLLAVVSVGLLLYVMTQPHSEQLAHRIFVADTVICGVFAVEFLHRWRRNGWHRRFLASNWYEILGMIPIAHPALRSFRLIRIVVLVVRLMRAMDRAFGEKFTYRLVERFSRPIVLAIKKPITIAVLDEVVDVLETGNYPANLSASLQANRDQLRAIVAEKLREDPMAGRLRRVPFHDEIVESVIDTGFRVVLSVLADERIDDFFAHVVAENRAQIRLAVLQGLHEKP